MYNYISFVLIQLWDKVCPNSFNVELFNQGICKTNLSRSIPLYYVLILISNFQCIIKIRLSNIPLHDLNGIFGLECFNERKDYLDSSRV